MFQLIKEKDPDIYKSTLPMNNRYIPFDFEILKYWESNGVEQVFVLPLDDIESRVYGNNMPFRLKPKNHTEQGHLYTLASKEVDEFAYNESDGLTFLVHENDLYISQECEKKASWLSSRLSVVKALPILNRLAEAAKI